MKDGMRKHAREVWVVLALLAVGIVLGGCGLFDLLPTLPPAQAPTEVTASNGEFPDRIRIAWAAVERATTYKVFRANDREGDYLLLDSTLSLTYTDTVGAENQGRLYWYKVEACNSVACSPKSAAAAGYAGYPPAPTNIQATNGTYPDKIVITWDPVPGATHYQVFRDRNPDVGFPIVPGGDNVTTTSFDDATAIPGTRYWYRVKACHATGCSALSDPDSGCLQPCPPGGSLDAEG